MGDLTESNQNDAKLRHEVGVGDPEELYRWEAEVTRQRQSLSYAIAQVDVARVDLNRAMGFPANEQWQAIDVDINDNDIYFLNDKLEDLLKIGRQNQIYEFMKQEALTNSPVLDSLN